MMMEDKELELKFEELEKVSGGRWPGMLELEARNLWVQKMREKYGECPTQFMNREEKQTLLDLDSEWRRNKI